MTVVGIIVILASVLAIVIPPRDGWMDKIAESDEDDEP